MMKFLFAVIILSSASYAMAEQFVRDDTHNYTGTYVMNVGNREGGRLTVIHLPDNELRFALECNRGAPSYNSGEISGTVGIKGATAIFRTTEFGGECQISLKFHRDGVIISQTGSDADCGFGFGVHCNGKYRLQSRKRPDMSDDQ